MKLKKSISIFLATTLALIGTSTYKPELAHASGSSYTDAMSISLNEIVSFTDPTPEDNDDKINYYVFETNEKGTYSINFASTGKGGITEFIVTDSKYNKLYESDWLSYESANGVNIELKLDKNAVYYIRANAMGAVGTVDSSGYTFKIKKGSSKNNLLNTGNDGKSLASSIQITLGDVISYTDPTPEDNDDKFVCYRFETTSNAGSIYNFNFASTGKGGITDVILVDSNYTKIVESDWLREDEGGGINRDLSLKENSTYYILANAMGAVGTVNSSGYDFKITEQINTKNPGKPIISSVKSGKQKFTISYSSVANGVSSYEIAYRVKGSSKWSTTTVKGSTLSKSIGKLKGNKIYQVRVRATKKVNGKKYIGKWSSTKNVKVK